MPAQARKDERPTRPLAELLAAAHAGSQDALGCIFEQFRPYLLQIANEDLDSDLRPKVGASDLVQQSFLEAQRGFPRFRGQTREEVLVWLRQILLHNLTDAVRRYRHNTKRELAREVAAPVRGPDGEGPGEAEALGPSPSQMAIAREQVEALGRARARLGEEQRLVIRLRHQEGKSFAEIGQALNRSEEAARKVWARAVEELREYMRDDHAPS